MKFLFDQNISQRILKVLPEIYSGSTHVKMEGLINSHDRIIWEFANWIRTGNLKTQIIIDMLIDNYLEILKFVEDLNYGCFEIVKIKK